MEIKRQEKELRALVQQKWKEGDRSADAAKFKAQQYEVISENVRLKRQLKQFLCKLHRDEIKAQENYDRELKCAAMRRQEWQAQMHAEAKKV